MSDNADSSSPIDVNTINLSEPWEVYYWTKRFNLSKKELQLAVSTVGSNVADVEKYLKGKTTT